VISAVPKPAPNRLAVLIGVCVSSFITPFAASSVNVALPSIAKEFGIDAVTLGWISTAYLLATATLLLPFGRLADLRGRTGMFACGSTVFVISTTLAAISTSAPMLIAVRVLQGIGGAMVGGTGTAILVSAYPPTERGKVLGISVATVYTGLSAGPFVGGFLTEQLGWRAVYFSVVLLGLIGLGLAVVIWRTVPETLDASGEKFDVLGGIIYSLTVLAVMYGFTLLPGWDGVWLILVGAVGLVAFVAWELREKSPVLDIGLFRGNAVFAFSNLAALINYSATFSVSFLLSLYLQYAKGIRPEIAGLVLVASPAMQAIFSPAAGRLSDRIEPRVVASIGMALTATGVLLLALLESDSPVGYVIACLAILGFGFALFSSPNTNAIMSAVDRRSYGVASATVGTMRSLGQMLSMAIAMLLLSVYVGRVAITPEYYRALVTSIKVAFGISGVLCVGGILSSLARGKMRPGDEPRVQPNLQ